MGVLGAVSHPKMLIPLGEAITTLSAKFKIHNSSGRCASRKTQFPLRRQSGTSISPSRTIQSGC